MRREVGEISFAIGLERGLKMMGNDVVDDIARVTATVDDASANPTPNISVVFSVSGSVNTGGTQTTDTSGNAQFCYQGPNLPGAEAKAVIPWRSTDRDHPDARVTISPLVDIRSRLVEQADVVVFTVKSTQRTYWRLTSLERFDGRIWSSNRQYRPATGTLQKWFVAPRAASTRIRALFTITRRP